jgi:hypothetical protein
MDEGNLVKIKAGAIRYSAMPGSLYCLSLLLLLGSMNGKLHGQTKPCPTTLHVSVKFEKIKLSPDTTVLRPGDGVSSRIGNFKSMRLIAANKDIAITSFNLMTIEENGDVIEIPNTGNYLDTQAMAQILRAKKGSTFYFECIRASLSNGTSVILEPLTITL